MLKTNNVIIEQELRRKAVKEAAGLCTMAGSPPSPFLDSLLVEYIDGTKTMDEIRTKFEQFFKEQYLKEYLYEYS